MLSYHQLQDDSELPSHEFLGAGWVSGSISVNFMMQTGILDFQVINLAFKQEHFGEVFFKF
jgi:hypothetical protein